jgi:hypothetical protein
LGRPGVQLVRRQLSTLGALKLRHLCHLLNALNQRRHHEQAQRSPAFQLYVARRRKRLCARRNDQRRDVEGRDVEGRDEEGWNEKDAMAKDVMAKDAMKPDAMAKDAMAKDAMKK